MWLSIALTLAVGGALLGGLYSVSGPLMQSRPLYRVMPDGVTLTPTPPWVRADVRREALHQAGLDDGFSTLEPRIAERLGQVFALHPWVEAVEAVRLEYPGRVEIDLRYRQPVLMVEVPGGLYPVDGRGILLPSADFKADDAARYPRLTGVTGTPGPVGAVWSDPVLLGGAALAARLRPVWDDLQLFRLVPAARDAVEAPDSPGQFELETVAGRTRIRWGYPPNRPHPDEADAEEKLARLKRELVRRGGWDRGTDAMLDLRPKGPAQTAQGDGEPPPASARKSPTE